MDLAVASSPSNTISLGTSALIGTSGREPYGALSVLRFGCEAIVDLEIDLREVDNLPSGDSVTQNNFRGLNEGFARLGHDRSMGATRCWGFTLSEGRKAALLSSPTQSWLTVVTKGEDTGTPVVASAGTETLTARQIPPHINGTLSNTNLIIQVGAKELKILDLEQAEPSLTAVAFLRLDEDAQVAAISPDCRITVTISEQSICTTRLIASSERDGMHFEPVAHTLRHGYTPTCATMFTQVGRPKPVPYV